MNDNTKKIVVFDFDGTLVDSMETFADIAAKVMSDVYGTPFDKARRQYIQTSGLPFFMQLEQIYSKDPRNSSAADRFESEKVIGYFDQNIYPDADSALTYLQSKGIKTAVSSNNFQHLVDKFIENSGLRLDYILGFKSEAFCKGRTHFAYLLEKTGLAKENMLFVGDSIKDAERADDFLIDFIGKTGVFNEKEFKSYRPDIKVIDHLEDLKTLL